MKYNTSKCIHNFIIENIIIVDVIENETKIYSVNEDDSSIESNNIETSTSSRARRMRKPNTKYNYILTQFYCANIHILSYEFAMYCVRAYSLSIIYSMI